MKRVLRALTLLSFIAGCGGPPVAKVVKAPVPPGPLSVETTPSGVMVFADGEPIGKSPLDIQMPVGEPFLAFFYAGKYYQPQFVTIKSRAITSVKITLKQPE